MAGDGEDALRRHRFKGLQHGLLGRAHIRERRAGGQMGGDLTGGCAYGGGRRGQDDEVGVPDSGGGVVCHAVRETKFGHARAHSF